MPHLAAAGFPECEYGTCLEGTMEEMWTSLAETLGALPPETRILPGHEYTVANLEFGTQQVGGYPYCRPGGPACARPTMATYPLTDSRSTLVPRIRTIAR